MRRLALLSFVLACRPPGPAVPSEPPPATRLPAPQPGPPQGQACAAIPGTTQASIMVDGVERTYVIYVGPNVTANPSVLFVWHGWGGQAPRMLPRVQPDTYWSDAVVVVPQGLQRAFGLSSKPGWQNKAGELGDRDFALFDTLLASLQDSHCIDPKRVYTTGFSNGSFFSNTLACNRSNAIAAAAPRSGGGPRSSESCGGPVPILVHHGRTDFIVPFKLARQTLDRWAKLAGCEVPQKLPTIGCVDIEGCTQPIRFCGTASGHNFRKPSIARDIAAFVRQQSKP